jgi:hypothetical protein
VNSTEDRPVSPKDLEIRRYMNKIEIVTSVGFAFHITKNIYICSGTATEIMAREIFKE